MAKRTTADSLRSIANRRPEIGLVQRNRDTLREVASLIERLEAERREERDALLERVECGQKAEDERDNARKQRDEELRERLEAASLKDEMFQEAVKHLSFESPEHQEEYVWGLVDGIAKTIADSIFEGASP